jgi:hypothetical protein
MCFTNAQFVIFVHYVLYAYEFILQVLYAKFYFYCNTVDTNKKQLRISS